MKSLRLLTVLAFASLSLSLAQAQERYHHILRDARVSCRDHSGKAIFDGVVRYAVNNYAAGNPAFTLRGNELNIINVANSISSDCNQNRFNTRLDKEPLALHCASGSMRVYQGLWNLGQTNGCEVQ